MIPSRALLGLLAAWTLLAVPASAWPGPFRAPWILSGVILLGLLLLDGALALMKGLPILVRSLPRTLPVGVWCEVRLRLTAPPRSLRRLELWDGLPGGFESEGLPRHMRLRTDQWTELRYRARAPRRGVFLFTPCQVRLDSPLGLWQRLARLGGDTEVRVFPDFAAVRKYAQLATSHRLNLLGVHRRRRRGEGMEFHQLREFREGDSPRQVDWKATSRMRKLISREYAEERDQQVLFLLDCGRRMRAQDGPLSHFDHALTGLLLLAHVALREGDAVGLLSYAGETERWVPPRKGAATLNALLQRLFDLQPTERSSDLLAAAQTVLARLHKRALVVVLTNLRDEDDETLHPALALLRTRHRALVASLRERALDQALDHPANDFPDALLQGAVHHYLEQRRDVFDRLALKGAHTLDLLPEQLPVALVNRYLQLKRSGAV